jgi:SAM-dependent methyltransferase
MTESLNDAQIEFWNTAGGETWAGFQAQLDRQMAPLGEEGVQVLAPRAGEHILDIGCGCGDTTLALAKAVGAAGSVVGVDVSRPMLEVARNRPADGLNLEFIAGDAQTADLGAARFDAVYSRFGVMFFADPAAAFANIRAAIRPGGRMTFVCWRPLADNAWFSAPMAAARPFLPPAEPAEPNAPGPFAFSDPDRVKSILGAAGFSSVTLDPFDTKIGSGDLDATLTLVLRVGPLGWALREHPEAADKATEAVRSALATFDTPQGVLMPAAVWIVSARNG